MEKCQLNYSIKNNSGLTLLEVLIALAILAIALTAVIKTTSQNIVHTRYLEDRTISTLVGTAIMNEAKLGLLNLPLEPNTLEKTTQQLGKQWLWKGYITQTANKRIQKIIIDVYSEPNKIKLTHLVSYRLL